MDSTIIASLIGFITAVVGTIISHFLLLRHSTRQFAEYYRNKLFDKQLAAYEKLWGLLPPTSRASSERTILYLENSKIYVQTKIAKEFCDSITLYFFSEHGLYLSKSTRQALFNVREELWGIYSKDSENKVEISKDDKAKIQTYFLKLHTTIRDDLGLRALKFKPEDIGINDKYLEP